MNETILRKRFEADQEDAAYNAWLQEKEFSARYNAEQSMPADETEFLTRYTTELIDDLKAQITNERKRYEAKIDTVERSVKEFSNGLDGKLPSSDLAVAISKERKRSEKELSYLTAEFNTIIKSLDARINEAAKQKPVIQQIMAPEKKLAPKLWSLDVVSRVDGLMKTVVASADGVSKFKITIARTPDNFPTSMNISEI